MKGKVQWAKSCASHNPVIFINYLSATTKRYLEVVYGG